MKAKLLASIFGIAVTLLPLTGCMGTKFNYTYAQKIRPGMTTDEVLMVMQSEAYTKEVHGDETQFVWAYFNLAGMKEVRVRFDQSGHVIADPIIFGDVSSLLKQVRYEHALELVENSLNEEALKELLWCFDKGVQPAKDYDVRQTKLLATIARLGETYPPALAALRERRDKAEQQVLATADNFKLKNPKDLNPSINLCRLNHVLKDDARTLQLYDKLPAKDARKSSMGPAVFGELTTAQRYQDAVEAMNYQGMSISLDYLFAAPALTATDPDTASLPRAETIELSSKYVEALAGIGDLDHARPLAERILAYDDSVGTNTILQQHATRAGHPELFATAAIP